MGKHRATTSILFTSSQRRLPSLRSRGTHASEAETLQDPPVDLSGVVRAMASVNTRLTQMPQLRHRFGRLGLRVLTGG